MIPYENDTIKAYLEFNNWVKKVYKEPHFEYSYREFENLPESYMCVICLHFIEHKTFREIGKMLGFSKSNAQAKLYNAYRRLNRGDFK